MSASASSPSLAAELLGLGLDREKIPADQALIRATEERAVPPHFPLVDGCRLDNAGILGPQALNTPPAGVLAFIPAAGMGSRYNSSLAKLTGSVYDPLKLQPKAFSPCVREGYSFLDMKCLEHSQMPWLTGQVFIAPQDFADEFRQRLQNSPWQGSLSTAVMSQDRGMATLRCRADGQPYRDEHEQLIPVPSGHGMLVRTFPKLRTLFPQARTVWIRNIDNVSGASSEVLSACTSFLALHALILETVATIRAALRAADIVNSDRAAATLLTKLGIEAGAEATLSLLTKLFHSPLTEAHWRESALKLLSRPVVLAGQVPKVGLETGGVPAFAEVHGKVAKLCVEGPHIAPADNLQIINTARATHFNAMFMAIELQDEDAYSTYLEDFRLVVEKDLPQGKAYHVETPIGEVVANSISSNVVFVEIPRCLFNPHKTIDAQQGKMLADWCDGANVETLLQNQS